MKASYNLVNPAAPVGAAMHMPFALLGLGYLAAVLEKNQYQVDVIDCQVLKFSLEDLEARLASVNQTLSGLHLLLSLIKLRLSW